MLITAGLDKYQETTESSTKSVSASGGTNGSGSASTSTSTSKSSSTSLVNVNSSINVGHLESDAQNFTLRGAEVMAETADLNVDSLTVQSLQDTSESSNSSKSRNVGAGFGGGGVSSVNAGFSNGKGSSESNEVGSQTQLLIGDGANSQITAKDTTLIGGLIANATKNEDGTLADHGKLNLTTETLTVSDLQDRSKSDQRSTGMQVSTGLTTDESGKSNFAENGTTTVNLSHSGHKREGETQATLGLGNVTVGGKKVEETNPELNRDVNQAQITTLDQQTGALNASVTVDNKVIIDAGKAVAEGVVAVAEGVATVVHAYTKDLPPDMVEKFGPEAKALYRKLLMGGLTQEEELQLDDFINTAIELNEGKPFGFTVEIVGAEPESPEQRAARKEFKFQAVGALGDAGALLNELPMDQVETGFKLVSLVTGGPVKYAISEGVNAVIGDSVDYLHGQVTQGIADWSQSYVGFDESTAERQTVGAELGLALIGAATGLIPRGSGKYSLGSGNSGVLKDGDRLPTSSALDAAIDHLGPNYKEIAPGVFKSADGTKMIRMTDSDLAKVGNHASEPHMNFESGRTVVKPNGKEQFLSQENKHIFLPEEK